MCSVCSISQPFSPSKFVAFVQSNIFSVCNVLNPSRTVKFSSELHSTNSSVCSVLQLFSSSKFVRSLDGVKMMWPTCHTDFVTITSASAVDCTISLELDTRASRSIVVNIVFDSLGSALALVLDCFLTKLHIFMITSSGHFSNEVRSFAVSGTTSLLFIIIIQNTQKVLKIE